MRKIYLLLIALLICAAPSCTYKQQDATYSEPRQEETKCSEHIWQEATCTSPKECIVCGETEGDSVGHKAGEFRISETDYINATIEYSRRCTVCKQVLETKEKSVNKLYKNGTFLLTPEEFCVRLDNELSLMRSDGKATKLKAQPFPSEGRYYLAIADKNNDLVAMLGFLNGKSGDAITEDQSSMRCFSSIMTFTDDDCSVTNSVAFYLALVTTLDPSLSIDDAKEVVESILIYEDDVEKNGISYSLIRMNGKEIGIAGLPQ